MNVRCPHCSTGYLLPDHLLGPRGARVRCPHCGEGFVVLREPHAARGGAEAPPAAASLEAAGEAVPPVSVAFELLDALAAHLGPRLEDAQRRGRVLSELGPDLIHAWDEFRSRLGERGSAEVFRRALRERWSVDLGGSASASKAGGP